jgi:hypothetical protein
VSVGLVTAATLADYLGVSRAWVYENALRLGAVRLGDGPKARLRFDLEHARSTLSCSAGRESESPVPAQPPRSRARRRDATGTSVVLLPIRGQIRGDRGAKAA